MGRGTATKHNGFYIAGLALVFIASFAFISDSKRDLNGDNCGYYMLATSLAEGHGYADIMTDDYAPSNVFPPGYPLLMSAVRLFTDSFFLHKVLNGLFLPGSAILFFFFIKRNRLPDSAAFVASAARGNRNCTRLPCT